MVKATWNGATIAESDDTVIVEGNHYFPRDSVDASLLRDSDTTTICPWKGNGPLLPPRVDGARTGMPPGTIPIPSRPRPEIRDRIAFWKGVEVG